MLFKRAGVEALANEHYVPLDEAAGMLGESPRDVLRAARQAGYRERRMRLPFCKSTSIRG